MGELKDFYMAVRVDLLEIMGFQQTFEGGEGMEFFSFKDSQWNVPKVKAYLKYLRNKRSPQ